MELRRFRYFEAVAEELNFRAAAERLHVSQPAVSSQIAQLEREIGTALFVRDKRSVALTEAGVAFLGGVRATLAAAEHARAQARAAAGIESAVVRIGFPSYLDTTASAAVLTRFIQRQAPTPVEVVDGYTLALMRALRRRALDAAFLRLPLVAADLEIVPVDWEPILFAVSPDHPLAGSAAPLDFAELAAHDLVLPPSDFNPWLHDALVRPFTERGLPIRVATIGASHPATISAMLKQASRGDCVVPVPAGAAQDRPGLRYRSSADPGYGVGVALAHPQGPPSPPVALLRMCLAEGEG